MGEADKAGAGGSRGGGGGGLRKALEDLASRPAPLLSTFSPSSERGVEGVERQPGIAGGADGTAAVFLSEKRGGVLPFVALFLLFCTVQLDFLLLLAGPFLLPFRLFSAILGLFLFLSLIPLYQNSSFAHKLSRFLCKYALGYFPVAVHVEDLKAFDSNEAYGEMLIRGSAMYVLCHMEKTLIQKGVRIKVLIPRMYDKWAASLFVKRVDINIYINFEEGPLVIHRGYQNFDTPFCIKVLLMLKCSSLQQGGKSTNVPAMTCHP